MSSVLTPPDLVVISQNPGIQCHHPKFFVLIHSTKAVSSVKVMFSTATANRRFMAGSRSCAESASVDLRPPPPSPRSPRLRPPRPRPPLSRHPPPPHAAHPHPSSAPTPRRPHRARSLPPAGRQAR